MPDDNYDWLLQELNLTAERARDRGLSPEEYLVGIRAYANTFEENYKDTLEDTVEEA